LGGLILLLGHPAVAQQEDVPAPRLVSVKISPEIVDVSLNAVKCTLDLEFTDRSSGVVPNNPPGSFWVVELRSPSGRQERVVFNTQLKLTRGTPLEGVYSGEFAMPQYSEPGVWKIAKVQIIDLANNWLSLNAGDQSGSRTLTVVSEPADVHTPRLISLTFDPPSLTERSLVREVTVRLKAKDDLSGVSFTPDDPRGSGPEARHGIDLRSPSGTQKATAYRGINAMAGGSWTLVNGTPQDGVWQTKLTLPESPEPGVWKVWEVCLKDAVRNIRCYTSELSGLGIPDLVVSGGKPTGNPPPAN